MRMLSVDMDEIEVILVKCKYTYFFPKDKHAVIPPITLLHNRSSFLRQGTLV